MGRIGLTTVLSLAAMGAALAQDTAQVQHAVLWERTKDAAASRQAGNTRHAEVKPVESKAPEAKPAEKAEEGAVQEALKWERAKDRAAARQSHQESAHPAVAKK